LFHKGFHTIIIRHCLKNIQDIRSYKKSGFREELFIPENFYKKKYENPIEGDCDPYDDLFLVKGRINFWN